MDNRIKKIVLDSIRDPRKSNTIISPEEIPSVEQEAQLRKYNIPLDVDAPIRDAVIELNQKGLITGGSCCGHNAKNPAFITFDTILTKKERDEAARIIARHGMVSVAVFKPHANVNISTTIDFKPIPTPDRKWWTPDQARKAHGISLSEYEEADKVSVTAPRGNAKAIIDKLIFQRAKAIKEGDQETASVIAKGIVSLYKSVKQRKLTDISNYIEQKALPTLSQSPSFKGRYVTVKKKVSVKSPIHSATIRISRSK